MWLNFTAQDVVQWWAPMNMLLSLRLQYKVWNFPDKLSAYNILDNSARCS
jgi:hypothetical protein